MNDNVTVIRRGRRKEEHRRQQLVVALLQQPSMEKAAESVGISAVTAWRISKTPEFQDEYSRARRDAFAQCMARLQQAGSAAASTLLMIMEDRGTPAAVRVRAAECVLRHASQSFEMEALAARVQSIEQWMKETREEQEMTKREGAPTWRA